jgi:spermidine synthase
MAPKHDHFPAAAPGNRLLPLVTVLFIGSGCAALIYEIVWFQMLSLVIGSSAVSLGVLLGTFMGGMCLGSLLLPRWISPQHHPLRVYAWLELGIGVIGVAVLLGMPAIEQLYAAVGGHGPSAIAMRGVIAAICLLPPTLLMGATLPAVARWVEATPSGIAWLGFFYGGNLAGAVLGCLVAGFYLLRVYDMAIATYVAAAVNLAVALLALAIATRTPIVATNASADLEDTRRSPPESAPSAWTAYLAIALSGCAALGAEVIWTRQLSLLLGGTVYTFSIILAIFLVGLGIGSSAGALLSRTAVRPRTSLGFCQLLLTVAITWTAWQLARSLPYWPINPYLTRNSWDALQLDLVRVAWSILPAALLWGASFPLALASVAAPGQDPGRLVGGVYAANTIGAIVGALAFSIVLVGQLGTQDSQRLLILCSTTAALLVLVPALWQSSRHAPRDEPVANHRATDGLISRSRPAERVPRATMPVALGILAGVLLAALLVWSLPPVSRELIAHGRNTPLEVGNGQFIYVGEGMNSSVAVTELASGVRNFHVSGKIEASSEPQDMRLQRMLGHLPALVHPEPKSVLVVGCGAGVTAGSFMAYPSVKRIVICEIEPLIPRVVARHFGLENHNVVGDKALDSGLVEVIYDDARHYILTTDEKFDIITSDPINPWVKGAATLYTEEYFNLCKRRLAPGGVITQWVPLYESNAPAVKSELATFLRVFPGATVWSNDYQGQGYDVVLLGSSEPTRIDIARLHQRLERLDHTLVAYSLGDVGFSSALDLLATYAAQADDLKTWLADAQINRDRNLRLQYLAGLGANEHSEGAILAAMKAERKFPEKLFAVSAENLPILKRRIGFGERKKLTSEQPAEE